MSIEESKDMFDLGSAPIDENFDPFAAEDEQEDAANESTTMQAGEKPAENVPANAAADVSTPKTKAAKTGQDFIEKPPIFVYAGATENISDSSMTFDELRIDK